MTREVIGKTLSDLRKRAKLSREDVAELLDKSPKTIGHWETGHAMPDANMLFILCKIYDADLNEAFGFGANSKKSPGPLRPREETLLTSYRQLNDEGQEKLVEYADDLVQSGKYIKSDPSLLDQEA